MLRGGSREPSHMCGSPRSMELVLHSAFRWLLRTELRNSSFCSIAFNLLSHFLTLLLIQERALMYPRLDSDWSVVQDYLNFCLSCPGTAGTSGRSHGAWQLDSIYSIAALHNQGALLSLGQSVYCIFDLGGNCINSNYETMLMVIHCIQDLHSNSIRRGGRCVVDEWNICVLLSTVSSSNLK